MNTENEKKFYIGLDIGTESVGFAATDENYRVLQKRGKPLMGVRLFEEANTADERRGKRANKVRMKRRAFRIELLQELLAEEVNKVDPLFFIRLGASSLWKDDKLHKNAGLTSADSLFADSDFSDKDFFKGFIDNSEWSSKPKTARNKLFPSAYHLRNALMNPKEKPDIRFVYLACHHILKARGHFLYDDESMGGGNTSSVLDMSAVGKDCFVRLNKVLKDIAEAEELPYKVSFCTENFSAIEEIAKNDTLYLKDRKSKLLETLFPNPIHNKDAKKQVDAMLSALLGKKAKLAELFPYIEWDEESKDFSFGGKWEDETKPKLAGVLADDNQMLLIDILKEVYDWYILMQLLKGKSSVSAAMVERYQKHHEQLAALKKFVKEFAKDKYFSIFRSVKEKNNYPAYIGSNLSNGKTIIKKCSTEDFYAFLRKELGDVLPKEILDDITAGTFLQKLRSKDNATIPHQLHKAELSVILNNAQAHGLLSADTAKKILDIISFRVPYYVGRLNPHYKNTKGRHVWIEKLVEGRTRITPWNFNEIVDKKNSNKAFIGRMLSKCTYLRDETVFVLPKNSLLYARFSVLNELNNLKYKDVPISVELKQKIFNDLFKTKAKVSFSALLTLLKHHLGSDVEKSDITGVDMQKNGFNSSYSAYVQAEKIFKEEMDNHKTLEIVEDVLLWHALHTDKKLVVESIRQKYPHLSESVVKELKGLNFSGFGRLSKKFLTTERVIDKSTGQCKSVIDILWETNYNLMELRKEDGVYNITDWLNEENSVKEGNVDYDLVAESYASPSVKRSVWQAMKIVDELIELNAGKKPDRIFIEVTRTNREDKKATKTRKDKLSELYSEAKKLDKQIFAELEKDGIKNQLEDIQDNNALRGEKLFLYFLQCGKCAYSGETIKIADLDKLYDVDHIIPQALKKDDGISNKVLSKRNLNGKKGMHYPFRHILGITDTVVRMWEGWHRCNLISDEKLARLKRTTPLKDKELEGFIARQLVFTGQSTTAVAELLKLRYPNAQLIYSKAENVSDFRQKFNMLKCREANDLHHAHDAYLNIVVGNCFYQRFNKAYITGYEKDNEAWTKYTQNHLFEKDIKGAWKAGEWERGEQKTIGETEKTVAKALSLKYLPISKLTTEYKGSLFKLTVLSAESHQKSKFTKSKTTATIPLKGNSNNPLSKLERYGGFAGIVAAYCMIIEYTDKKGKIQREFDFVSILNKKQWEKLTHTEKEDKLSQERGFPVKIVLPKIYFYTLFKIENMEFRLSGCSKFGIKLQNAKQPYYGTPIDDDELGIKNMCIINYMRILAKYNDIKNKLKTEDYEQANEIVLSGKPNGKQTEYKITKCENQALWNALLKKICKLYGNMHSGLKGCNLGLPDIYEKIAIHDSAFSNLPITRQVNVLSAIISGLGCNAHAFNLSGFYEKNKNDKPLNTGLGQPQPSLKIKYPLTLIHQSVTGIKEHSIVISEFDKDGNLVFPDINTGVKH
ncbi:MAG: type II CRISPR RNA-guided endonuclease Cas9 [Firmicutes bacterium]|nr:type II CRISPR RNA-guided endonuclease Cas9 [Bacillota bacterium]